MTLNVGRLRKAVDWVEYQDTLPEDDREWNQNFWYVDDWDCGTTSCIAGRIALQAGYRPVTDSFCQKGGEPPLRWSMAARTALGVVDDDGWLWAESSELFDADNDAGHIRVIAERMIELDRLRRLPGLS